MLPTNSLAAILLLLLGLSLATGPSAIIQPQNGSHIAPGGSFPFTYHALGDYCQSSFGFSVYLFTSLPHSILAAQQTWSTGHYFGRYSLENYPANPSPTNTPPASLVMPDFSLSPGGFGTGETASNRRVWLVVLEETATCEPALGVRFALEYVELLYNATGGPTYSG